MGQAIGSATEMVSYAGDLRRAANQMAAPELAANIQSAAAEIEKTGLGRMHVATLKVILWSAAILAGIAAWRAGLLA
jgi:hypothetical protein